MNRKDISENFFMLLESAQGLQSGCHLSDDKKNREKEEEEEEERKRERNDISLTLSLPASTSCIKK